MDEAIRTSRALLVAMFFLNIADAVLTWIVVPSGRAVEMNPVAAWLMTHGGAVFLSVKIGAVSAVLVLAWFRLPKTRHGKVVRIVLSICTAVWAIVVGMLVSALVLPAA